MPSKLSAVSVYFSHNFSISEYIVCTTHLYQTTQPPFHKLRLRPRRGGARDRGPVNLIFQSVTPWPPHKPGVHTKWPGGWPGWPCPSARTAGWCIRSDLAHHGSCKQAGLWSGGTGQKHCLMAPRRRELPKHRGRAACNQGARQC